MSHNYAILYNYVKPGQKATTKRCIGTVKSKAKAKRAALFFQMQHKRLVIYIVQQKKKVPQTYILRFVTNPANESIIRIDALSVI